MQWPRIRGLCRVSWCLAEGQWNGDQRHPIGRKAREGLYSLSLSLSLSLYTQTNTDSITDSQHKVRN